MWKMVFDLVNFNYIFVVLKYFKLMFYVLMICIIILQITSLLFSIAYNTNNKYFIILFLILLSRKFNNHNKVFFYELSHDSFIYLRTKNMTFFTWSLHEIRNKQKTFKKYCLWNVNERWFHAKYIFFYMMMKIK